MAAGIPFWDIHNGIWTMLEAWAPWEALVKERNRLKHIETAKDAIKYRETVTPDTVPEVAVIQGTMLYGDRIASNDSAAVLIWHILVTTGDERFDSFFDIQWHTFRACLRWDTYLHDALTWNGSTYVTNCELEKSDVALQDLRLAGYDLHRDKPGWAAIWTCQTECEFKHSALVDPTIT